MEQQNKTKRIPWNKGQKGVISSPRKGLTLIEEYGEERAKEIRDKIKKARAKQVFSEEAKEKHRLAIRKSKLGKTYEEMYGVEKTNEIKQKQRLNTEGFKHLKLGVGREKAIETKKRLFKEGKIKIWNKGIALSEERKRQIGINTKKLWQNPEFRERMNGKNHPNYGKKLSEEHRRKLSEVNIGNKNMLGKHATKETREKMRIVRLGKTEVEIFGKEKAKEFSERRRKLFEELWQNPEWKEKMNRKMWGNKEFREKMIGKNSSNWMGGKSFEPYTPDFNERFKESIRARDNYCCVVCNKSQEELKYKLSVHHVDYDKLNSFKQNAVSLCNKNHAETNVNRTSWKIFFQSLLKERYGYEYTEDQKIILDFTEGA